MPDNHTPGNANLPEGAVGPIAPLPGNADLLIGPSQLADQRDIASGRIGGKAGKREGEEDAEDAEDANREIGDPGGCGGSGVRRGWHCRGYLPHFDGRETTQHVTFHLADSLPADVLARLERKIEALPEEQQDIERRRRIEAWIDAGHGSCVLGEPILAAMVQDSLLFFDAQRYRLLAWVVMPNHVHVLFQPMSGWTMAGIVGSWKKFTARRISDFRRSASGDAKPGNANLLIGALKRANQEIGVPGEEKRADREIGVPGSGPVWHREYWDRFIRNARHFQQTVDYIHMNPVKAGLVAEARLWMWSSALIMQEKQKEEQKRKQKEADQEIGVPRIPGGKP